MNSIDRTDWSEIALKADTTSARTSSRKKRASMSCVATLLTLGFCFGGNVAIAAQMQEARTSCATADSHVDTGGTAESCGSKQRVGARMDWIGILAGIDDSRANVRAVVVVTGPSRGVEAESVAMGASATSVSRSLNDSTRDGVAVDQ